MTTKTVEPFLWHIVGVQNSLGGVGIYIFGFFFSGLMKQLIFHYSTETYKKVAGQCVTSVTGILPTEVYV